MTRTLPRPAAARLLLSCCAALAASTGCGLPNLQDLLGGGPAAECEHSRDCADDEICDGGSCRPLRGAGEGEGGGDPGEGEGEGEGEGDVPSDPQGPQFLQFATNVTTVHRFDTITFTAVLTDPDGVDDVIGGSLVDPGTQAAYGAFSTSASEGSYSLSLTWDQVNVVAPIDFANTGSRTFQARFFDVAGHVAERSATLSLTCDGSPACAGDCGAARCGDGSCTSANDRPDANGNGLCGNACFDLTTSSRCGSCETSCSTSCGDFGEELFQCVCNGGADCTGTDVCVDSTCLSDGSISIETSNPAFTFVSVSAGGFSENLCDITATTATLVCQSQGFATGSVFNTGGFTTSGVVAHCTGASSIIDCNFTTSGSCSADPISCGDGGGGGGGGSITHHTGVNGETFTNDAASDVNSLQGAIDACNAHFGVTTCGDACPTSGGGCTGVIVDGANPSTCTCTTTEPLVWNHGGTSCFTGGGVSAGSVTQACSTTVLGSWD